jgi:hypothetical protein
MEILKEENSKITHFNIKMRMGRKKNMIESTRT